MPDEETLYDRVDEAIARGEVWRAKEILRGNTRVRGYDVDLYERYGRLLLSIGEMSEAGKYLFLSGRRSPEYEETIAVYLARHVPNPEHMYFSFPRAARLKDIDEYPEEVRRTLEAIDFPVGLDGRLYPLRRWREHGDTMRAKQLDPPPRVFIPTINFRWRTVWPDLPGRSNELRAMLRLVVPATPLEVAVTALKNLLLFICLAVGVWVVVDWLGGRIL